MMYWLWLYVRQLNQEALRTDDQTSRDPQTNINVTEMIQVNKQI